MNTVLFKNGDRYTEKPFKSEAELERLVVNHSKQLFGAHSLYIDVKKKIDNAAFGGVIPDGFLFDLSDLENPEFYIVEVELAAHDFFRHIFPQVTKFFAFFKNTASQNKLIEKLYTILETDNTLLSELKSKIGKKEVFKFLKDTIENSQNILMIIDDEKTELPEIIETYTDTWGKMVKVSILKEYQSNGTSILSLTPEFENIGNIDIVVADSKSTAQATTYTEDFHLDGIPQNMKGVYTKLIASLRTGIPELTINPQRYYISLRKKRNFAFIKARKKKILLVAMAEESRIRKAIQHNPVKTLADSVQKFYNGPCARIELTSDKYLQEVIDLLIEIQR